MRRLRSEDTCRTWDPKNNLVMNSLGFIFGSYISGVELEKQKTQMPIGIDKKQAPAKVCSLQPDNQEGDKTENAQTITLLHQPNITERTVTLPLSIPAKAGDP